MPQEDDKLVLAPAWVDLAQLEDSLLMLLGPGGPAHVMRPAAALFEAACPVSGLTLEPVVDRGAAEAEVTRSEADLPAARLMPSENG
jgi:hypothetical protein